MRRFFLVFSSSGSIARIIAGRTVRAQSMLMNTPLASTMPSSGPSLKLKNTSASNPTTVVSELEAMEETEPASAVFMAETLSLCVTFSCR